MSTLLPDAFIRLATAVPAVGRSVLTAAAYTFPTRKMHWALRQVASELDCRVPVDTHLGNGMKIRVIWGDSVGVEILARGYYEPPTVRLMEQIIKPGMVVIDAGAHVGQYTLLAAGLGASVHSFEPDPRTFQLLQHNVRVNGLSNVRLNQCALTDSSGRATLHAGPQDNIGSGSIGGAPGSKTSHSIQCLSLDSYLDENRIREVHVMKIDVEGAELLMLQGAQGMFAQGLRPRIIVEFAEENQRRFGLSGSQLAHFLEGYGYELLLVTDSGPMSYVHRPDECRFLNVLARPSDPPTIATSRN